MKKLFSVFLSLLLLLTFNLSACGTEKQFVFSAPDGAPALAIAGFMENNENFGSEGVEYRVVPASAISTEITVKASDFVIIPVNLATKLYAQNGGYKMASVITHGNLYISSSFEINSVSDLKNKVVLLSNSENSVIDLTLKVILKENGLEFETGDTAKSGKVVISYFSGATANSAVMASMPNNGSENTVALLPEPAITVFSSKKQVYSYRFDLQKAYDKENCAFPQAVLMVKNSVIKNYPNMISEIESTFSDNVNRVKQNPTGAVSAVKAVFSGSSLTTISTSSIEKCNIYWGKSQSEKQGVINYINAIKGISENSASEIGDEFFM